METNCISYLEDGGLPIYDTDGKEPVYFIDDSGIQVDKVLGQKRVILPLFEVNSVTPNEQATVGFVSQTIRDGVRSRLEKIRAAITADGKKPHNYRMHLVFRTFPTLLLAEGGQMYAFCLIGVGAFPSKKPAGSTDFPFEKKVLKDDTLFIQVPDPLAAFRAACDFTVGLQK